LIKKRGETALNIYPVELVDFDNGSIPVMNPELAASPQRARATIQAELATALRNSNGSVTNIESAIAAAGVPAHEISATFGSNRELILAMVRDLTNSMCAPLLIGSAAKDLRERLHDFAQRVTEIYATSHLRALYRIAITESIRHTGLGRDFYEAGPGRLTQQLADFLQIAQCEGALGAGDPHLLASHFLSSLRAHLDVAGTYSPGHATSAVAEAGSVRKVVGLFFDGIHGGRQPC
jgi:hypothetical protein